MHAGQRWAVGGATLNCLPANIHPALCVPFLTQPEQKGQLGLGDTINRNNPTPVPGLSNKKVGWGWCSCGRERWVAEQSGG